jgi:hypothetical protein
MQHYPIPLVPGPVSIPEEVLAAYQFDYGSADLEEDFFRLYARCERDLQTVLGTQSQVTIQTGEGMLALWGALKSVLRPGDRVLAVATGIFGYGIGEMARQLGAEVEVVGFGHDQAIDPQPVWEAAKRFRPAAGDGRPLRDAQRRVESAGGGGRDLPRRGRALLCGFCGVGWRRAGGDGLVPHRPGAGRQPEGV